MLVLSRKAGQAICIGPDITVRVLAVTGNPGAEIVKIGLEAPQEVNIIRTELKEKLEARGEYEAGRGYP